MQIFNALGGNTSRKPKLRERKHLWKVLPITILVFLALAAIILFYTSARLNTESPRAQRLFRLAELEMEAIFESAREAWEKAKYGELSPVERIAAKGGSLTSRAPVPLDADYIRAASVAIIDATTGTLIFEKNANRVIPPASLTKVASMYTAFHLMEENEITMSTRASLPPETWAVNLPPRSSMMFLAQGQRVTIGELFTGMAVPSGNDAAIAIAINTAGSLESFVFEMNSRVAALGFKHTRFAEPTGLSEHNSTTALEFAQLCKIYIDEYPEALEEFHSREVLEYPKIWNIPEFAERNATADAQGNTSQTVVQYATNSLLRTLEGCDGLKTGYIDEAGYNFALTCKRGDERFIVVLLAGPNGVPGEGNGHMVRAEDGRRAIEWAFENFSTIRLEPPTAFPVVAWGGKQGYAAIIPTGNAIFTIPVNAKAESEPRILLPESLSAPLAAGEVVGKAVWLSESGEELGEIDLIAAESVQRAGAFKRALDFFAKKVAQIFR